MPLVRRRPQRCGTINPDTAPRARLIQRTADLKLNAAQRRLPSAVITSPGAKVSRSLRYRTILTISPARMRQPWRSSRSTLNGITSPRHELAVGHGKSGFSRLRRPRTSARALARRPLQTRCGPFGTPVTLLADLMLLPCGASPLDLFALKEALSLALRARAERRSKKPRIRFVPSRVPANTNLGRGLSESLEKMGKKVLPPIGQRIAVAEAVHGGLTMMEYAPHSPARAEFYELARAVDKILRR